jgi:hypothetical protein
VAGLATLVPAAAPAATKAPAEPLLVPVKRAHCHHMYGVVADRLKGRGRNLVSNTTRNGFKDFFVTRPGVIDCKGERAIPWTDTKDRDFIASVLNATNAAFKSKADMNKDYGIAAAPTAVSPARR